MRSVLVLLAAVLGFTDQVVIKSATVKAPTCAATHVAMAQAEATARGLTYGGCGDGDASSLPLLAETDLTYLGAFRVPYTNAPTSRATANFSGAEAYSGGGHYMAYNPAGNGGAGSLYVSGSERGSVAEITIPALVTSATITSLNQAAFLQDFYDISEGAIGTDVASTGVEASLTGLAISNGKLVGTMSGLYGTAASQGFTHFTHSLTLSSSSYTSSLVNNGSIGYAYLSGFMTVVPEAWQALLGGALLTGQCCLSVVTRTSNGMAAFSFNDAGIGGGAITNANPLVYYTTDTDKDTLGAWDAQNGTYGGLTHIRGMQIISGTRTLLYWGRNTDEPYTYGQGTSDIGLDGCTCVPGEPGVTYYYDPMFPTQKGQHGYPYTFQWWAYDLNDLAAVKAGTSQPWGPVPYGVWPITFPIDYVRQEGGMAYDIAGKRLFIAQLDVDNANGVIQTAPVIHVYGVPY